MFDFIILLIGGFLVLATIITFILVFFRVIIDGIMELFKDKRDN